MSALPSRLFCKLTHTWLRLVPTPPSSSSPSLLTYRFGPTFHNLRQVGDVSSFSNVPAVGSPVPAGAPAITLEWDSFEISDGDELYHTTWRNVEGRTSLFLPPHLGEVNLAATVARIAQNPSGEVHDETWMLEVEVEADREAVEGGMVEEGEYEKFAAKLEEEERKGGGGKGGRFGEDEAAYC